MDEFDIIERFKPSSANLPDASCIGDDAAVLPYIATNADQVVATDAIVDGVHFDAKKVTPTEIAQLLLRCNMSDFAAMGATPDFALLNLQLPGLYSTPDFVEPLASEIKRGLLDFNVRLVGGDTVKSKVISLSLSLFGTRPSCYRHKMLRHSASVGDDLWVTGSLGGNGYVWRALYDGYNTLPTLDQQAWKSLKQLYFQYRSSYINFAQHILPYTNAAIDLSDSLFSELEHIARASKVRCAVDVGYLPLAPCLNHLDDPLGVSLCLHGGEDYELLFTTGLENHKHFKDHPLFTVIGHVTDKASGMNLSSRGGQSIPLTAQGWDSFLKQDS